MDSAERSVAVVARVSEIAVVAGAGWNGIGADGTIIKTNEQVQEVWIGTTFGLASHMLSEGMTEEAMRERAVELLDRWVQFGAVSGVMRTKYGGVAVPAPSAHLSSSWWTWHR